MFATNPFSVISQRQFLSVLMQGFVVVNGFIDCCRNNLLDIIHKKNVKYFFENAKKAKKKQQKNLDQLVKK